MSLKNNQKGFGLVEGLLVVVALGIIGGAGYYVYHANKSTNESLNNTNSSDPAVQKTDKEKDPEENIPSGWVKYDQNSVVFYHPADWKQAENKERGEDVSLTVGSSTVTVAVYKEKPRIYYSSNAPQVCILENDKWAHYSAFSGTLKPDSDSDACDKVQRTEVEDNTIHSTDGGALGQYKYISVVELETGYIVIQDYRNLEGYGTENIGTAVAAKQAVESLVSEIAKVN